ncbi:MAG: 16S rRNA (adenine(1518)-N(6)/adenine(1519)-N(6))-dimethyltransferase RsmA [Bacteroidetes bacterium]|nr:16S rRNA (adenine(1518)-N(6)/adenine(1519)-N(6))-dimethyltransferase RsmA [Bacteroidota bacterium]
METHSPKKHLGQHFLKEKSIAERIASSLQLGGVAYNHVIEVGPGRGVLTDFLYQKFQSNLSLIEIDKDLIDGLGAQFPALKNQIYNEDFLAVDLAKISSEPFGLIGNFPYNISTQIVFKTIENRERIPEMVGMFQREVAQRICAEPGSKVYGILSAWAQTFYKTEYLFTVSEGCFNPPPKVKSGVIRLTRKDDLVVDFDATLLLRIIKTAFAMRRKTLRNSLGIYKDKFAAMNDDALFQKRPEQLGWQTFVEMAKAFK